MIEIRDRGKEFTADDGHNIYHFPTWEMLVENLQTIKRNPEEKIYLREGCRLERLRLEEEDSR